jgi:hypothetical protein
MAEQSFVLQRLLSRERAIERIATVLKGLAQDRAWKVSVAEHKPHRSDAQLRYLNGVCYKIIGDAIGYERDEVSEFLCGTYFGWKEKKVPKKPSNPLGIESVPIRTTTTNADGKRSVLGKLEFADYVAFCQRFAAKKGIYVPDPDPDYAAHREEETA